MGVIHNVKEQFIDELEENAGRLRNKKERRNPCIEH